MLIYIKSIFNIAFAANSFSSGRARIGRAPQKIWSFCCCGAREGFATRNLSRSIPCWTFTMTSRQFQSLEAPKDRHELTHSCSIYRLNANRLRLDRTSLGLPKCHFTMSQRDSPLSLFARLNSSSHAIRICHCLMIQFLAFLFH